MEVVDFFLCVPMEPALAEFLSELRSLGGVIRIIVVSHFLYWAIHILARVQFDCLELLRFNRYPSEIFFRLFNSYWASLAWAWRFWFFWRTCTATIQIWGSVLVPPRLTLVICLHGEHTDDGFFDVRSIRCWSIRVFLGTTKAGWSRACVGTKGFFPDCVRGRGFLDVRSFYWFFHVPKRSFDLPRFFNHRVLKPYYE
jgi:hypothetical protein